MEVKVFTYDYVNDLHRNVRDRDEFDPYMKDTFPYLDNYPKGKSGVGFPDEFELKYSEGGKHFDFENSVSLYNNLTGITRAIASDIRLWTYLTHVVFWKYMRNRWPIEKSSNSAGPKGRIMERYLLRSSNLETLTRNGISRLWWYAHLTIDKTKKDKFELTKTLLERQEIAVGLLERAFGADETIRKSILIFLQKNDSVRKNEYKTRELFKLINLSGGIRNLSGLEEKEVLKLINKISTELL